MLPELLDEDDDPEELLSDEPEEPELELVSEEEPLLSPRDPAPLTPGIVATSVADWEALDAVFVPVAPADDDEEALGSFFGLSPVA